MMRARSRLIPKPFLTNKQTPYHHHSTSPKLKMQLSTFLSSFALLTLAATALAQDKKCTYTPGSYTSVCQQGNNLFCTGNVNTGCETPKVGSIDAHATDLNVKSCVGKKKGDGCDQYFCCK